MSSWHPGRMGNRTEGRRNVEGLQSRKESVLLRSPFALLVFACLLLMLACLQPPLVHRALKHRTVRKARSKVRTEPLQSISKWLPCHQALSCRQLAPQALSYYRQTIRSAFQFLTALTQQRHPLRSEPPLKSGHQKQGSHGGKAASLQIADAPEEMLSRHEQPLLRTPQTNSSGFRIAS